MPGVKGRSGGRNRKPAAAHILAGTFRKDRHGDRDEPEAVVGKPHRPPMPATARREWTRLAQLLESEQRLTLSDGPMLTGAALAYDAAMVIRLKLRQRNLPADVWLRLKTGERMSWVEYRKFCSEMCLSASSRARATTGGAKRPDAPVNPMDKWLNRKRG